MIYRIRYYSNLDDEESFIEQDGQLDWSLLTKGDTVMMEFGEVSFVAPFGLLGLLIRCRQCFAMTANRVTFSGLTTDVYRYLNRMRFFDTANKWVKLENDYSSLNLWDVNPRSRNLIEITQVDESQKTGSEDILKIAGVIKEREKDILSLWLGRNELEAGDFVTVLSEIAQNIFEWSGDNGYVALNKYKYSDRVVVKLAIIDGGSGLHTTVKKKIGNKYSHGSDYICHPFLHSLSRSKGGGLFKVFDFLKQWDGFLLVRSGGSYAYKTRNKVSFEKRDNAPVFNGTHFAIVLRSK